MSTVTFGLQRPHNSDFEREFSWKLRKKIQSEEKWQILDFGNSKKKNKLLPQVASHNLLCDFRRMIRNSWICVCELWHAYICSFPSPNLCVCFISLCFSQSLSQFSLKLFIVFTVCFSLVLRVLSLFSIKLPKNLESYPPPKPEMAKRVNSFSEFF
jgi:hypothetical protein